MSCSYDLIWTFNVHWKTIWLVGGQQSLQSTMIQLTRRCCAAMLSFCRSVSWCRRSFSSSAHSINCLSCSASSLTLSRSADACSSCRSARARALSVSSWSEICRSRCRSESRYSRCSRASSCCSSTWAVRETFSCCVYEKQRGKAHTSHEIKYSSVNCFKQRWRPSVYLSVCQ